MTVQEFQARNIERIAQALVHFMETTDPARLEWQPEANSLSETRNVLEMLRECYEINRLSAALLRGETVEAPDFLNMPAWTDKEKAAAKLQESAVELAASVKALKDDDLTRTFPHWVRPLTGAILMEAPYRNMAYHAGQINLIQLLDGDTEFHRPPGWMD